jgi:hypothetical protein
MINTIISGQYSFRKREKYYNRILNLILLHRDIGLNDESYQSCQKPVLSEPPLPQNEGEGSVAQLFNKNKRSVL